MKHGYTQNLFFSRFLCAYERDDIVAVFHKLRPEPIFLLKKNWSELVFDVNNGTNFYHIAKQELISHKLLVHNFVVDEEVLKTMRQQIVRILDRPTILYLMMSENCNFSCGYCPFSASIDQYKQTNKRFLSFEDSVAGISLWQKHINDYPRDDDLYFLIFYGGEPLLNRDVFVRLLRHIETERLKGKFPEKFEIMLCTNGSLIDDDLLELLALYKVTVAIGIDGPYECNDFTRVTNNNIQTSKNIQQTIHRLVEKGVCVVASVIITTANSYHLSDCADFLQDIGISKFGFNLMKGSALVKELADSSKENYCRVAAQGVLSGLNGNAFYEHQLEKKLLSLYAGLPFSVDCTCYGNQLVIQTDGQVTNCPFLRFNQGHIRNLPDSFRISETKVVQEWRSRLGIFNDSILMDLNNNVLNGGGCAWSSFELYGDVLAPDFLNTLFTEEVLHELIWSLLPKKEKDAILREEKVYWNYRGIGAL